MDQWSTLLAAFRQRFDDPDLESKMIRRLESLTQTGSAALYANDFEECLNYVEWSDSYAIHRFDRGLKPELRLQLIIHPRPHILTDWIPIVVEVDNKLHSLRMDENRKGFSKSNTAGRQSQNTPRTTDRTFPSRSGTTTTTAAQTFTPAAPVPSGSNDVVPMEVDAIKHGKITPEERERRRKEGLCFYCGVGKHLVLDCPDMSAEAKLRYAQRKAKANPSSGKA